MLQDQRRRFGNFDGVIDRPLFAVGNAKQYQWRAVGMALIMPFHRHDFSRLMLQRIDAVKVTRDNLKRRDDCRHPHRHREHFARARIAFVFQQMPGPNRAHGKGRCQIGRQ